MPAGNVTAGATYGHEGEAWHRLIPHFHDVEGQSFEQARIEAGMTWDVETSPIYDNQGQTIKNWQALRRDDNGVLLSIQQDSYAVISMAEVGYTAEFVLDAAANQTKVAAMVELNEGRQIYVTFRLPWTITVPGDAEATIPFLVLATRHDGRGGMRLGGNSVRPICVNTAGQAEAFWDRTGMGFTIRHTANWADKLHDVRAAMRIASENIEKLGELYLHLADREMTRRDVNWFLNKWSYTALSTAQGNRAKANSRARRETYEQILASPTCAGISATMYGGLMAATEMTDHHMFGPKTTSDTIMARQMERGSLEKRQAFMLWARRAQSALQPNPAQMRKVSSAALKARSLV
jgi:phage/plasmid-like protein (TIGR03299 family)